MKPLKFKLHGRVPSKKNSRISTRSGRSFPSKKYMEWHKDASAQLQGLKPKKPLEHVVVQLEFAFPDNRRADLTNKAESIMDLLVDNGFLVDDKWQCVEDIRLRSAGVDRDNPLVRIQIHPQTK